MKNDHLIFRPIQPDELPALLELYRQLILNDEPAPAEPRLKKIWREILADEKIHLLVAEFEGRVAATCILTIIPNLTHGGKPYCVIENVVTLDNCRNKGIGTGLLKYAQQTAWDAGCYKVMLMTGRQTPEIYRFYEGAGFQRGTKTAFNIRREDVK